MQCTNCGFSNPAGNSFCGGCGSRLAARCGTCGADNPPGFRYCGGCGAPLATPAHRPASSDGLGLSLDGTRSAERRQLTVMFCDLVGSTSLASQLDPEELREIVHSYQSLAASVITAYEGHVAQYLGDGVLAYFGFPLALENEAGRAVRSALDLLREMRGLSDRLERSGGVRLSVRIGIHTGVVVVGEIGSGAHREQLALGETPNIAARIQAIAPPDTVVLSGDTFQLIRGEFQCEDLGERPLRGVSTPVHLFRPVRELLVGLVSGETAPAEGLLGRDEEIAFLEERWARAIRGSGQVVMIEGDAGLGKTSLVRALAGRLGSEGHTILEGRCLPYFRNTPYHPVVELLRRWLGRSGEEQSDVVREHLEVRLRQLELGDEAPVLSTLLSAAPRSDDPVSAAPSLFRADAMRSALLQLFLRAADEHPTLLYIEDVQWADPSTRELLGDLADAIATRPMLALFTQRPDFRPSWEAPAHQSALHLPRLARQHVAELISRVAGGRPLPPEVVDRIVARTDGVPLFVEELTKMVLESGLLVDQGAGYELAGGVLPPLAIPLTLHDSLEARLERLSAVKELAQIGAVIGREFRFEVLRAVTDADENVLRSALRRLVEAEILVAVEPSPPDGFAFKHALIQEVAYQSLLRGVRQTYHLRVAKILEERFPDEARLRPEIVAQHFTAAGLRDEAVRCWTLAGRRAVERSAAREAILHLHQGLELLDGELPGTERDMRELDLLLALGPALVLGRGHASSEVRDTYARALALTRTVEDPARRFEALGGLFSSYFVRSESAEAYDIALELMQLAADAGRPEYAMAAHVALGVSLLGRGAVQEALRHLDEGVARYDRTRDFVLTHGVGQDFGVVGLAYGANAHLARGRLDRAATRVRQAVELAQSLSHPHSLALALSFAASADYLREDVQGVEQWLSELVPLATRHGYAQWLVAVPALEAWAQAAVGNADAARRRLKESDATRLQEGTGPETLFWRHIAADALLRSGRTEAAERMLAQLRPALANQGAQLWWASESFRLHGQALARLGHKEEARAEIELAVAGARAAGARFFLRRALRDLASLDETAAPPALRVRATAPPGGLKG